MSLAVLLAGLLISVGAQAQAPVPASLRNGLAEVIEDAYHGARATLNQEAFAAAASIHPVYAKQLSRLAGEHAAAEADRVAVRRVYLRNLHTGLSAGVALDEVSARMRSLEAEEGALLSRLEAMNTGAAAGALQAERARLSALIGELEALFEQARLAARGYEELERRVGAGSHPLVGRQQRLLSAYNAELEQARARMQAEREAQSEAVTAYQQWFNGRRQVLEEQQQAIDALHLKWEQARARESEAREAASRLVGDYNARVAQGEDGPAVQSARTAALASQAQLRAALAEAGAARRSLLDAQARGQDELDRVTRERASREAVLASARKAMDARHARMRQQLAAEEQRIRARIAALERSLQEELAASVGTARDRHSQLEARFGKAFAALHAALSDWFERGDESALKGLAEPDAPGAAELWRLSLSLAKAAPAGAAPGDAASALRAELRRLRSELRNAGSRAQALRREFEASSQAFASERRDQAAALQRSQRRLTESLQALTREAAELGDWFTVLQVAAAQLRVEFEQLLSAASDAPVDAVPRERWRRTLRELQARAGAYESLVSGFASTPPPVSAALAAAPRATEPVLTWARLLQPLLTRTAPLQELGLAREASAELLQQAVGVAVTNWTLPTSAGDARRFLEGRYRWRQGQGLVRDR